MKSKANLILILMLLLQACNPAKFKKGEANLVKDVLEENYPWRVSTTTTAIDAINLSITNLLLDEKSRNVNFPADPGPYNVKFNQTEIESFAIIGYSYSDRDSAIYEIEFRPERIKCCDIRITVRINIQTNEALMVFMKPDA
jgi:hypothetical protein